MFFFIRDMSRIHASTISIHSEKVTVRGIYQCRLVDVGGLREERTTKWAQCFRNTSAVMYVIDCSAFDINLAEDSNKVWSCHLFFFNSIGLQSTTPRRINSHVLQDKLPYFSSIKVKIKLWPKNLYFTQKINIQEMI